MSITAIFALGFAPGIFWLWYFYKQDKWEPEPKLLVIKTFCWGFAAALVAAIFEAPFIHYKIFSLVVLAPVVEELTKFSVVRFTMYNNPEFDEPMDGITYAAAAALGFASVENSFYLLSSSGVAFSYLVAPAAPSASDGLISTFVLRALLSVPGHVLFSSMWGYALGWGKFVNKNARYHFLIQGYLLAITFHSVFNFLAILPSYGSLLLLLFVPVLWKVAGKRIHTALANSPFINEKPSEQQTNQEGDFVTPDR